MASYLLAVLAAMSNATSNVLQRKANLEAPSELSMSPRLITEVVRRPAWLGGFAAVIISFLLMAAALRLGRLAAVQPIVVLELPLTLIIASRVLQSRLTKREWFAAGAMTVGLGGLIASLAPTGGNQGKASGWAWTIAVGATLVVILSVVIAGARGSGTRRPALLGVATGLTFGLTAAFMKGMTAELDHGLVGILTSWQTYAMAASGIAAMYLLQTALHAGRLLVAQPGITLSDPVVAIVWGIAVFHESAQGGIYLLCAIGSGLLMAIATVVLARSPLLEVSARGTKEDDCARKSSIGRSTANRRKPG